MECRNGTLRNLINLLETASAYSWLFFPSPSFNQEISPCVFAPLPPALIFSHKCLRFLPSFPCPHSYIHHKKICTKGRIQSERSRRLPQGQARLGTVSCFFLSGGHEGNNSSLYILGEVWLPCALMGLTVGQIWVQRSVLLLNSWVTVHSPLNISAPRSSLAKQKE